MNVYLSLGSAGLQVDVKIMYCSFPSLTTSFLLSHRYGAVPGRGTAWGRTLCRMLSDAYSEFNYTECLLNYNAHCKQTMNVNIVQNARHRF